MYRERLRQLFRSAQFPVQTDAELSHFVPNSHAIGQLRELSYFEQWKLATANKWYHVRMEDHSLFIFNDAVGSPSYSFLHAPIRADTMREFLKGKKLDITAANVRDNIEEYDLVLETAPLRSHVLPIRFDYDVSGYRPGVHPVAHLHIGLDNNLRIALSRRMSAQSFVLFVMRHLYPESWERLLAQRASFNLAGLLRTSLPPIPPHHWSDIDCLELSLS